MLVEKKSFLVLYPPFFGMQCILALLMNTLIFLAMFSRRISFLGSANVLVIIVDSLLG